MLNDVMDVVLALRVFLAASLVFAVILELLFILATRHFSFTARNLWIYGLLLGIGKRQTVFLAGGCAWFLLAASSAVSGTDITAAHLVLFLLLGCVRLAALFDPAVFIRDTGGGVLIYVSLISENILLSYLRDTRFQWQIAAVLAALVVFICVYSLYFLLRDVQILMHERLAGEKQQRMRTGRRKQKRLQG